MIIVAKVVLLLVSMLIAGAGGYSINSHQGSWKIDFFISFAVGLLAIFLK